jgi:hypothetical protein
MTSIAMVNQWHRRRLVNKAMDAYLSWREQCIAVRTAYSYWEAARPTDSASWFDAYSAALDREEHASELYASLAGRIGRSVVVDFEPVAGVFAAGGLG